MKAREALKIILQDYWPPLAALLLVLAFVGVVLMLFGCNDNMSRCMETCGTRGATYTSDGNFGGKCVCGDGAKQP